MILLDVWIKLYIAGKVAYLIASSELGMQLKWKTYNHTRCFMQSANRAQQGKRPSAIQMSIIHQSGQLGYDGPLYDGPLAMTDVICLVPVPCISSMCHMYMTDFAYDGPIFLVPLSLSYPSSPVLTATFPFQLIEKFFRCTVETGFPLFCVIKCVTNGHLPCGIPGGK